MTRYPVVARGHGQAPVENAGEHSITEANKKQISFAIRELQCDVCVFLEADQASEPPACLGEPSGNHQKGVEKAPRSYAEGLVLHARP
jgi:hypothetical protein